MEYSITVVKDPKSLVGVHKSSVVVDDTSDVLALVGRAAAAEELVYHPVVVVILFVVLKENVGLAKIVEFVLLAKVGGAVTGGLVKVVIVAMNVSLKALASLFCAPIMENSPSPLLVGVVTLLPLLPPEDGFTDRDKLVSEAVAGEVYGGEAFCLVHVADEIPEIVTRECGNDLCSVVVAAAVLFPIASLL